MAEDERSGSPVTFCFQLVTGEADELREVALYEQAEVGDYIRHVLVTHLSERRVYREWKAGLDRRSDGGGA